MAEPTQERIEQAQRLADLTQGILVAIWASRGGEGENEVLVDASEIYEALAYASALIIEFSPHVRTNKDMREAAEQMGSRIHKMLKAARGTYEQTGRHPIEAFGAMNAMGHGPN